MSYPEAYNNPDIFPCSGSYTWIPPTPPSIGSLNPTFGFNNLIIDRGKFRNYWVKVTGEKNIIVTSGVENESIQGDLYEPIINSTRPLVLGFSVKKSKNNNVVISPKGSSDLLIFDSLTNISGRLSTIMIEYDLSFWVQDEILNSFQLTSEQLGALDRMKSSGVDENNLSIFLKNLLPNTIDLIGVDTSGNEYVFPIDTDIKGVQITRLRNSLAESELVYQSVSSSNPATGPLFSTVVLKIKQENLDRNAFPLIKKVFIRSKSQFENSSLVLVLKKITFYSADRVNFRHSNEEKMLPVNAVGYSMYVNGYWYPALAVVAGALSVGAGFYWPQDAKPNNPNIHVKLFNPDYKYNSPGFAQSLNLHLLIVAFPIFGPLADFLLPGVLLPYLGVIVSPLPFTKQLIFKGTSLSSSQTDLTAVIPSVSFKQNSGTVTLLENGNPVFKKDIISLKKIIESGNNFYNSYEFTSSGSDKDTQFQNLYNDQFGIQTLSESYTGVPTRSTQFLQAFDIIPPGNIPIKKLSYQTYVSLSKLNLFQVITESEPALIFKLQFSDDFSSSAFQEAGFYAIASDCFCTDKTNLFDTKLVYHIYAAQKDTTDFSPMSDFSKKHSLKVYKSEGTTTLSFENFDSSWDFENVLVSANINALLQTISTEVIINSTQKSFSISSQPFDLYCAVYAVSVLSYDISDYDITQYSSLDVPVINFSIDNNFIVTLPIYYKKSYSGGGTLQPIRDFGYTGDYTKDVQTYKIYDTYYTGKPFDNSVPYSGTFNSTSGYYNLLSLLPNSSGNTNFSIQISSGSSKSGSITEIDFVMETLLLENAKIAAGTWEFQVITSNTEDMNLRYKIEIDLVNFTTFGLISKILNTNFSTDSTFSVNVDTPFYIPNVNSILIVRLFIENFSSNTLIDIDSFSITKNTIEYFSYKEKTSVTGVPATFYEDLPVQPNSYVGNCNSFFLKLDLPSAGYEIFDALKGLFVNGAIYSPTWQSELLENLEIDYRGAINSSLFPSRASGVQPYQLFFRTGTSNKTLAVDTKKHQSTGLIVTLANYKSNSSDYAVVQIVSESYARFFKQAQTLQTILKNDNLSELNIQNPVMATQDEIVILGQLEEFQSVQTISLVIESPGEYAIQPGYNNSLSPIDDSGYIKGKMYNCMFTSFDVKNNKTYTAGVTSNGNLLFSEDSLLSADQTVQIKLLEGNPLSAEIENLNIITDNTEYYGLVSKCFCSVLATKTDDTLVLYVYESSSLNSKYSIYARIVNGGTIYEPVEIINFRTYFEQFSPIDFDFPSIENISACHSDLYPFGYEYYISFVCFGKIFLFKLLYDKFNFAYVDLAIVYGNLAQGTDVIEQKFNTGLNKMIRLGALSQLTVLNSSTGPIYSKNLENRQRPGIVDFDNTFLGIQFFDGDNIMEVVFDKSYTVTGELRVIGTTTGVEL